MVGDLVLMGPSMEFSENQQKHLRNYTMPININSTLRTSSMTTISSTSPPQEAHVGLAIMGREGRAAVRAADFAFTKFRFLQKVKYRGYGLFEKGRQLA